MRRLQTPFSLLLGTLLVAWAVHCAPPSLEFEPGCEALTTEQANKLTAYIACCRERDRIECEIRDNPQELIAIEVYAAILGEYSRRSLSDQYAAAEWLHGKLQGKSLLELRP